MLLGVGRGGLGLFLGWFGASSMRLRVLNDCEGRRFVFTVGVVWDASRGGSGWFGMLLRMLRGVFGESVNLGGCRGITK